MPTTWSTVTDPIGDTGAFDSRMIFGDFDGDGDIDILYQNGNTAGAGIGYLRNDGGTFTNFATANSVGTPFASVDFSGRQLSPAFFFVRDFDGDGDMDILDRTSNTTTFFQNNGGSFARITDPVPDTGSFDQRMVWGDWDGDGDLDALYQNGSTAGAGIGYLRNDGGLAFTNFTSATSAGTPFTGIDFTGLQITTTTFAIDVDDDGDMDILDRGTTQVMYRNNGNGSFTRAADPLADTGAFDARMIIGDFDSDGDTDVLYQNGNVAGTGFGYFRNDGGTFTNFTTLTGTPFASADFNGQQLTTWTAVDIDGDGDVDIVDRDQAGGGLVLFRQNGAPPTLVSASPSDNSTGVGGNANITLTFSESVTQGNGNIYIYRGDGVLIETISVGSAQVSGSGTTWTIDPSVTLAGLTNYYIRMDQETFADAEGAVFAGIDDNTTLNFTTASTNTAPTFTNLNGDTVAFTEGTAVRLDTGGNATVADAEQANFNGGTLTVSITANEVAGQDVLGVANIGAGAGQISVSGANISYQGVQIGTFTGGSAGADLVITLDGDATPAATQALVRALTYNNTSDAPNTAGRTVTVVLTDGAGGTSATQTVTVGLTAVNDAPVNTLGGTVTLNEDAVGVSLTGMSISDGDADAATDEMYFTFQVDNGAIDIRTDVVGGIVVGDIIAQAVNTITVFASLNEINATLAASNGLTYSPNANFSGDDTLTVYSNDAGATGADPGLTGDGTSEESVATRTLTVVAVNDAPVLDLNGATAGVDNDATYTEQAPIVTLASGLVLTDDGATLTGATVQITGGFVPLAGDGADYLGINGSGAGTISGISYSYSALTGILTLTGAATVAAYEATLAQVTFQSTANNPGASRSVTWTVNDGTSDSAPVTTTITVTEVNDAPVNAVPGAQNGTEDSNLIFSTGNGNAITVSDVDAATLTVTLTVANGLLTLSGTAGLSFSVGDGASDATMTFTGTAAAINTALDGLIYRGDLNYSGGDTLTVTTNDNGLTGADPGASGGATDEQDVDTVTITLASDGLIDGDGDDNTASGTAGADIYDLSQGGDDTVSGLGGDDGFYFGGAYTSADSVDGGAGSLDQVGLQGNYGSTTLGAMTGVEQLVLLAGDDTRFGDTANNFYDYVLTATDATLAAGQQLVVQANALRAGEDLTFDGSAETDGSFLIYGGRGVDTLTGGAGDDGFFFGESRWGASDVVNGGAGTMDQLGLQGNFNITFGAGQLIGLEFVVLMSAVDTRFGQGGGTAGYSLTMNNGNVAAGQTLVVSANTLQSGENLSFNGSAETDGRFEIFSGDGNDVLTGGSGADVIYGGGRGDTLTGGAGNDIFAYRSVTDSNSTERDGIQDFNAGDRIDLSLIDANINAGGNQDFTFVGANAFTGTAGELRYENISLGGPIWLVQGDVNGDGVSDLEIVLVISPADPITAADFIGVNPAFAPVPVGKKYEESQVMPAEAGATAPDESRPTEPFTRPDDDRSLTLGHDGFLSFGPADGDDDFLVLAGDFADQPLVLPGQPDGLHADLETFEGGRGPEFPSSGDVALTLADDSQAFSDNWMDVSGLYNWC